MLGRLTLRKFPKNVVNIADQSPITFPLNSREQNRTKKGKEGETLAALALQKKGMKIICRNFRSSFGEIDLTVMDGEVLVFVEVKNWPAFGYENLGLGINHKKRRRIIETAKFFLNIHRKYNHRAVRFDVVFIKPGEPVLHLISAFTESE